MGIKLADKNIFDNNGCTMLLVFFLNSNLILGNKPKFNFLFLTKEITWKNSSNEYNCNYTVPCNNYAEGFEIGIKILNFFSFYPIPLPLGIQNIYPIYRDQPYLFEIKKCIREARSLSIPDFNQYDSDLCKSSKFSDKKWAMLSFFREAIDSDSIYYKFLCYYKIIEGEDHKSDQELDKNIDNYIKTHGSDIINTEEYKERTRKTSGEKIRRLHRNAIAHFSVSKFPESQKKITYSFYKYEQYQDILNANFLMNRMSIDIIRKN
jgi:hypothetical protein